MIRNAYKLQTLLKRSNRSTLKPNGLKNDY